MMWMSDRSKRFFALKIRNGANSEYEEPRSVSLWSSASGPLDAALLSYYHWMGS